MGAYLQGYHQVLDGRTVHGLIIREFVFFFVAVFGKYLHLGMTSYKRINESGYLYFDICIYETYSMTFTQRIDVKESITNIHYYLVPFHFGPTSCPFQQSCKKESRLFKKRLVHTRVFFIAIIIT